MAQTTTSNGRSQALDSTITSLKKRFGEGAIMKLGDAANMRVESIPTGSLSL
ncbi:MAG: DNA recombination/repair protein RecA, partial [Anaerolineae bacterium]|nr:DNA recombination/repair protein RecA [Anaerolineae bacterium]